MYSPTGDVVQAFALVFLVLIFCLLRTATRFFKKPAGRFLLEALLRSILFLTILSLLYRNPLFETKIQKTERTLIRGTTDQTYLVQSGKSTVIEVNKVAGVLLQIIHDMETKTAMRSSDHQKIQDIKTFLQTGVLAYNMAAAQELGISTSRDIRQMLAPLETIDDTFRHFLLQDVPPGSVGDLALPSPLGEEIAVINRQALALRRAQQVERLRARNDVIGQVTLRVQEGVLKTAASASRIAHMSDRILVRMEQFVSELRHMEVRKIQQISLQQFTRGLSTETSSRLDQQEQAFVHRFLRNVGGYLMDLPAVTTLRQTASQLFEELQEFKSLPKTFEEKLYTFAGDVLHRFQEFDHLVATRKIRDLLAQSYNIGDIIETKYHVVKGKTKVLLENIALSMTTSVFMDDLGSVLVGLFKIIMFRKTRALKN